jgi:uncharacterized membrane protein
MEITLKTAPLFLAIALTGLSSGLFYAWEVSVIPGTKRISDASYLETMQSINRAILNPGFYAIFFGSLLFLAISTYVQYKGGINFSFWMVFLAMIIYLIGTFGVTVFGNVPLNDTLDAINLGDLSAEQLKTTREAYEVKWNALHKIRTLCAVVSFAVILLTQVFYK